MKQLYQLGVDVGMLNSVKNYVADVSSVSPLSEQLNFLPPPKKQNVLISL